MRIVFIRPCCIGDVVLATAALSALRTHYPDAHITWAVGGWSRRAIEWHPAIDTILDTGSAALPVKTWGGFWDFVGKLRAGKFDMAISLVRSPLMSLAVLCSGIPKRVGIDSNGRGFGYNLRLGINPKQARHEAQLYLEVIGQLGINITRYQVNLPVLETAKKAIQQRCAQHAITQPYLVINPAGGSNPGMVLDAKRYPPAALATIAHTLAIEYDLQIIMLAGPDDVQLVEATQKHLPTPAIPFVGDLTFPEIAALAAAAFLYIGNDTGLTHLAAASGAKTAMILGPSDPVRYAPFADNSIALWQPTSLNAAGVSSQKTDNWDWARDGISPETALAQLRDFLS